MLNKKNIQINKVMAYQFGTGAVIGSRKRGIHFEDSVFKRRPCQSGFPVYVCQIF